MIGSTDFNNTHKYTPQTPKQTQKNTLNCTHVQKKNIDVLLESLSQVFFNIGHKFIRTKDKVEKKKKTQPVL